MSKPDKQSAVPSLARRRVFAGAGTAGALAAAAAALPLVRHEPEVAPVAAAPAESDEGGYRLSAHVLRYYETTRV